MSSLRVTLKSRKQSIFRFASFFAMAALSSCINPLGSTQIGTLSSPSLPGPQNTETVTPSGANIVLSPSSVQSVASGATQAFTVMASTSYTLSSTVGGTCAAGSWSGSIYTKDS
jgi:hypothetical protein